MEFFEKLLSDADVATKLGVCRGTLQNWRSQGRGPAFVRLVGKIYYDPADIEEWLRGQRVDPLARRTARKAEESAAAA
jgi:predicted site-specific integrase-resolvase